MPHPHSVDTSTLSRFPRRTAAAVVLGAALVGAAALWTNTGATADSAVRLAPAVTSIALGALRAEDVVGLTIEPMGFYRVPDGADLLVTEWMPWIGDLGEKEDLAKLDEVSVLFSIDGVFATDWRCVRNGVIVRSGAFVRNQNRFRVRMDAIYLDHDQAPGAPGTGDAVAFTDDLLRGIEQMQARMIEQNAEAMQAVLRARPAPPPVVIAPPATPDANRPGREPDAAPPSAPPGG